MSKFKILFYLSLFLLVAACGDDKEPDYSDIYDLPDEPYNYTDVDFPATFTDYVFTFDNTPEDNQMTDEGVTLGRVLFYDTKLSGNETFACASCHDQALGFADDKPKSLGFLGGFTGRNSMGFANARFYKGISFFWDHRAATLEDQVLMPFQDPVEMGMTLDGLVAKVAAQRYYEPLFKDAFGDTKVTSDRISKALAQFVRAIYSFNTRYDEGILATGSIFLDFPNFTEQENLGKDIFNGRLTPDAIATCVTCHLPNAVPLHFELELPPGANQVILSGSQVDNVGLDESTDVDDNGVGAFFNNPSLYGHFKTPSLRNIELTGPYMHDGRFETLEEVVEHYSTGVKPHPTLSAHMKDADGEPRNLELGPFESAALVAFMKTFTDYVLINDERFSDPFVR